MSQKEKWWDTMIAKYGSEEAVRAAMKSNADKSSRNQKGTGYFATLAKENPEKLKQISANRKKNNAQEIKWEDYQD